MYDIRNMNIWKNEDREGAGAEAAENIDISELNLSVRSFNCLKRAGCNTIGEIEKLLEDDEHGLRRIRNLGAASESEILDKVREQRALCQRSGHHAQKKKMTIIKPAKKMWDTKISAFSLSKRAMADLTSCGIRQVKDLYRVGQGPEPGWYAVRELFEQIPSAR